MVWTLIILSYINAIVMLTHGATSRKNLKASTSSILCILGFATLIVAIYATATLLMAWCMAGEVAYSPANLFSYILYSVPVFMIWVFSGILFKNSSHTISEVQCAKYTIWTLFCFIYSIVFVVHSSTIFKWNPPITAKTLLSPVIFFAYSTVLHIPLWEHPEITINPFSVFIVIPESSKCW